MMHLRGGSADDGMSEYQRRSLVNQERMLRAQGETARLQEETNHLLLRQIALQDPEWADEYEFEKTNPTPHQRKVREMVQVLKQRRAS